MKRKKSIKLGLIFLIILTMLGTLVVSATEAEGNPGSQSGSGIQPIFKSGNPTPEDLGYNNEDGYKSFKIEPVNTGNYFNDYFSITVSNEVYFDWSIDPSNPIHIVSIIVKGGNNANLYEYPTRLTSDTGLHSPINPNNNKPYGLSHITFIYCQTVEPSTGSITIKKVVDGYIGELNGTSPTFEVTVSGPDDFEDTLSIKPDQEIVLSGLALGSYTIQETNIPDGYELVSISPGTVTLSDGTNGELAKLVTVTNRIKSDEPLTGSITIKKVVDGYIGEPNGTSPTFEVTVSGPDDFEDTLSIKPDQEIVLSGLALGSYTIQETNIPDGYELVSISPDTVTLSDGTNGELAKLVTVTNRIKSDEPLTGCLIIEKVIEDGDEADDNIMFTANVTKDDDDDFSREVKFSVNNPAELTGLAPGTYYVTEVNIPAGFEAADEFPREIYVEPGSVESIPAIVTIHNCKEGNGGNGGNGKDEGTITINKVITNRPNDTTGFTVNVTGPDGYDKNFTVRGGSFVTIDNLKPGNYTIKEINIPGRYRFVSISDGEETLSSNNLNVALSEEDLAKEVTITNRRTSGDTPPGDDDDDDDNDKELPPPDTTETEPEEPEVEPEEPEEEPEPEIIEIEPEEPEVELKVKPELPKTAGSNSLILYGLGILAAGGGIIIKKYSRKKDE